MSGSFVTGTVYVKYQVFAVVPSINLFSAENRVSAAHAQQGE